MLTSKITKILVIGIFLPPSVTSLKAEQITAKQISQVDQNHSIKDDAVQIKLKQITPYQDNVNLSGLINEDVIRFSLRKDQIVTNANLHLEYIPSPALLPTVSQLIVYLNNDIIATYPITQEQVGNKVVNNIPIDPNLVTTKNEIKFQFIGHYTDICENPIHSSLWLKILRNSTLQLNTAQIPVKNELSFLPFPFIDENDNQPSYIPIVFHGAPNPMQQQASAVLASWFATKSQWRGFQFDVTYNQLPKENAIVFITNQNKPDFLKNYAPVQQPTVELIDNPSYPNTKLLVLAGRNDQDLLLLAKALATSNIQLNGSKVLVNKLNELGKRQPYDAPNWLPIDQALTLGQIKTYSNQLTTAGYKLDPLRLSITLPPDLFALSKYSTSLNLKYRYTRPINPDDSKMLVYLNNQFLKTIRLGDSKDDNKLTLQIPVHQGLASDDAAFKIPGLLPEKTNELRFEPYFMSPVPGGTTTQCVTYQPVPNAVTIDDNSVIDFSKFAHYMAMPNLRVFINAGYPYSRMADLSETIIITPSNPTAQQMSLLLNTVGLISNKTGLPAYNLRVADKNTDLNKEDKDILLFADYHQDGNFAKLKIDNLHIQNGKNELTAPIDYSLGDKISRNDSAKVATQMTAQGNIGAIVGVESPYFKKRSVIAILANNNSSIELLNNVMINPNKFDISGGVSVIRESGVTNIDMGEQYHVGDLSAFEILQIKISKHPILAALIALLVLIIISFILAKRMKKIRHNRINND